VTKGGDGGGAKGGELPQHRLGARYDVIMLEPTDVGIALERRDSTPHHTQGIVLAARRTADHELEEAVLRSGHLMAEYMFIKPQLIHIWLYMEGVIILAQR
jgi:hypothetical protein